MKGQPVRFIRNHHGKLNTPAFHLDPVTGCLEWQRARDWDGYGIVQLNGSARRVHRVVWEEANGPIPDGIEVCHTCDNPPCGNLGHLFLGTGAVNAADRNAKGRQARGERSAAAKLTWDQVREIRELAGTATCTELGSRFGVHTSTVARVLSGRNWHE